MAALAKDYNRPPDQISNEQIRVWLAHLRSERRIERFDTEANTVSFTYRDYADHGVKKTATLSTRIFVRRFCQHLLPRSFTKIRHSGLLANHLRRARIPLARTAIAQTQPRRACTPASSTASTSQPSCPHCKWANPSASPSFIPTAV